MPSASKLPGRIVRVVLACEGVPVHQFEGCDGRREIRVELQTKEGHEAGTPAGKSSFRWATEITAKTGADGSLDFAGPAVHGKRGERFFYLSWSGDKNGRREMFRRIKIQLRDVTPAQLARVVATSGVLLARVHAVAKDGGPACASVPILDGWSVQDR